MQAGIDLRIASEDALFTWLTTADLELTAEDARHLRDRVAALVLSDSARALALATSLLDRARRGVDPHPVMMATAWRSFAEANIYRGRFAEARRAYEEASRWAEQGGDGRLAGEILVGRVGVLSHLGMSTQAQSLAQRARTLLEQFEHYEYLARLHMNLGSAAYHRERYAEALLSYQSALEIFETQGQRDPMVVGLRINLGIACSELSRVQEARQHFVDAERDARQLQLHHLEAQARFNRAVTEALLGDYRTALHLLGLAESVFEQEEATELTAATHLTRSEIYHELGLGDEAERDASAAVDLYTREEMTLDVVLSRLALARASILRGGWKRGLQVLQNIAALPETRDLPVRSATIRTEIARVELHRGAADEASRLARSAAQDLSALGSLDASVQASCVVARAELHAGRLPEALAVVHPLRRLSHRVPARSRIQIWSLAAEIERANRCLPESRRCYRRAIEAVEQQRALVPGVELRAESFHRHANIYRRYLDTLLDGRRPPLDTVFRVMESARARGFRERRTTAGTGELEVDATARSHIAGLVRKLQQLEGGTTSSPTQHELREARSALLEAERNLLSRLRRRADASEERWSGAVHLADLRTHLDRGSALVEYFVTIERVVALVVTHEDVRLVVLTEDLRNLEKALRRFHAQIETLVMARVRVTVNDDFQRSLSQATLQTFYRLLVAPLLPDLEGIHELILVPHDLLHEVPFECLFDGTAYINERWSLRRVPAADFVMLDRASRTPGTRAGPGPPDPPAWPPARPLVIAAESNGPAGAAHESRNVHRRVGNEARVLRDATAAEILEAVKDRTWVHWITHAVFRNDNPLFSHLAVRDGGLHVLDLRGCHLDIDVVVLSACGTGRVALRRSDDLGGIAHAFLEAGVRQVVASLWSIDDESTIEFMEAFYGAVAEGGGVAAAVRDGAARLRARHAHPYYWGGFAIYG